MSGVFAYMQHTTIWEKFIASSQHMEKILHEFDNVVDWGAQNGELGRPKRASGEPAAGFRDVYCYWIDATLLKIETAAGNWWDEARRYYEHAFGTTPNGEKWLADVLTTKGAMPRSGMRFPHARNSHPTPGQDKIWTASNYDALWKTGQGYGAAGPF